MYSTVIKSLEVPAVIVRLASTGTEKSLEHEVRVWMFDRTSIFGNVITYSTMVYGW